MSEIRTLADIRPDDRNANKGTARGRGMVETSLQRYGAGRSVLVDRNGKLIAGNKTTEAAAAIGLDDVITVQTNGRQLVVVQRTDLDLDTDTAARELAIADNRASELGLEWDADVLAELGEEIDLSTFWSKDELALVLEQDTPTSGGGDEAPAVEDGPTRVQAGDLYRLGKHRLLCGDSTKADDVARLMDGASPRLIYTDPPYGVDYDGGTKVREKLADDHGGTAIYDRFLSVLPFANDTPLYLWFSLDDACASVFAALRASGWGVRSVLIWDKALAQFGALSAQYKQQHEPLIYAYRRGHAPAWYGPTNEVTVWHCDRAPANDYHPTQKPVELAERAMRNSSRVDDVVADFFGGSGATVIAGERQRRRVYCMELEPRYCDVILKRWEAETGQTAERIT